MNPEAKPIFVAGQGACLVACAAAFARKGVEVRVVELERIDGDGYDLAPLKEYPPAQWTAMAIVGNDLLNLMRLMLMSALRSAGYRLTSCVSPSASVPPGWSPPENVFVDDAAVVGPGVAMRHNVFVGARAVLGTGARLGHSVWIGPGAIVGAGASIGDGTIIAPGVVVADDVKVGRQCVLENAGAYRTDIADGSFHSPLFDEVVEIHPRRQGARSPT